jgi:hypothetical protein
VLIVGAGMAGLLAGHMLRRHSPRIIEAQSELPNNHSALLRFRTRAVQEATGIPFREVIVRKALCRNGHLRSWATLADNNEYSVKVTGEVLDRSVLNLDSATRYIAPPDFIAQLAKGLDVEYRCPFNPMWLKTRDLSDPIISTMPMPVLMQMADWEERFDFRWREIWTLNFYITSPRVDVFQTIYFPDVEVPYYRVSVTGNLVTMEYARETGIVAKEIQAILRYLGLEKVSIDIDPHPVVKHQKYGKLLPIPENERKAFILAMTDRYGIWSLGRFGTWRQLLLDDVVADIRFIDRVIETKDMYSQRLHHHSS